MEGNFKFGITKPPRNAKIFVITKYNYCYVGIYFDYFTNREVVVTESSDHVLEDTDKWIEVERYNNIIV